MPGESKEGSGEGEEEGEMSPDIFDKLPPAQMQVIELLSINMPVHPPKRIMDALEKKGLIAFVDRSNSDRLGKFTWREPYMPINAHMAWCEWCSKNVTGDEFPTLSAKGQKE